MRWKIILRKPPFSERNNIMENYNIKTYLSHIEVKMQQKFKSIFDIIEEKSIEPEKFSWKAISEPVKYSNEEYIFEGDLYMFKQGKEIASKRHYILTLDYLIEHKVFSYNTSKLFITNRNLMLQNRNDL